MTDKPKRKYVKKAHKTLIERSEASKAIRIEDMRQKLKGGTYLYEINKILGSDYELTELPQAKMRLDGYFKLLNKVLPDLKAIEVTNNDNVSILDALKLIDYAKHNVDRIVNTQDINDLPLINGETLNNQVLHETKKNK